MRRSELVAALTLASAAAPAASAVEIPLQVGDPTPRAVWVRFENSLALSAVGQSFGPAWPGTWAVSGGVGRIELSAEVHGQARSDQAGLGMLPGTFEPFAVEIDLATLEATSQATSGALANPPLAMSFATSPLDTTATGGFVTTTELFCTSQAQVDALCPIVPLLCGQTCVLVPGSRYDPDTGKLHLVGPEQVQGCDGGVCFGPFVNFARTGDLQLTETPIPGVPAASAPGRTALGLLLAASAIAALRRRRRARALR
jgi:hypothetical protein